MNIRNSSLEMLAGVSLEEEAVLRLVFAAVYLTLNKGGNDNDVSSASRSYYRHPCKISNLIIMFMKTLCLEGSKETLLMEDDSLFDDTLSLQNLGISNASLATIVSEGNKKIEMDGLFEPAINTPEVKKDKELKPFQDSKTLICARKDIYMKVFLHI